MAQRPKHLKKKSYGNYFPKISKKNHEITSDPDTQYNCIAYAAGVTDKKYWPNFHPDYFWPRNIPKVEKIEAFIKLYESFGYSLISDGSGGKYIEGTEKIAIYTSPSGNPTHAAKQIGPSTWSSKLGDSFDIQHAENAVSGGDYGEIKVFMQRKKS